MSVFNAKVARGDLRDRLLVGAVEGGVVAPVCDSLLLNRREIDFVHLRQRHIVFNMELLSEQSPCCDRPFIDG